MQPELPALLLIFKERGLAVKLHTNGSRPALLKDLLERRLVDCIAMDYKASLDP